MPPSELAARLKSAADSSVQPTAAVREIPRDLPDYRPGQRFVARIEAALPDGTFRATAGDRSVNVSLAGKAVPGDVLELVYVDRTGHSIVARVADTGAAHSADATLSRAARLIGELFAGTRGQMPALAAGEPLLPAPAASAAALAPALRQAVAESGMFYESHQAAWLSGTLEAASLMREPQAAESSRSRRSPRSPARPAGADAGTAPATDADGMRIPAPLLPLVQRQLDALATHQLVWQLTPWPGQDARWTIEEFPDERGGTEHEAGARWASSIELVLPNLGRVRARISIAGSRLDLAIRAAGVQARNRMSEARTALVSALARDGLDLATVEITS